MPIKRLERLNIGLLSDAEYLKEPEAESLIKDIDELLRIIGSIQKTLKQND